MPKTHGAGASRTSCCRRSALVAGVGALLAACHSESSRSSAAPAPSAAPAVSASPDDEPALETVTVFRRPENQRGGVALVLLHGFGAAGDDLVSLAERLARPGSRCFVPAAPLAQGVSGRAWWRFDEQRPAQVSDEQLPSGFHPHPQVLRVRRAVQRLLSDIRARYAPERLVLGGFSQGAMLSLDVALQADPSVDRVAVLSGAMLADSLAALQTPHPTRPRFFISHGRQDAILPFAGAEHACQMLEHHGYDLEFCPFEGGHQIPNEVTAALGSFVFGGA